ncbi:50S ribosomal protein L15e [Candidatus Bathyarchaeota archaeon]|nr:50S ribosomal protein L15e [Candidatus Bathyarchaeota archaeon]
MYRYLKQAWKRPDKSYVKDLMRQRVVIWRKQPTITRVDKPTRLDRAHRLGYKAKTGFVILRVRIRRGGSRKSRPILGHRQKRMGVTKYTTTQSLQKIAEQRALRKYPNLKLLNSYWVWQDGVNKWYEIILVDPNNPHIIADKEIDWARRK